MKLFCLMLLFSSQVFATPVEGEVTYKLPNGDLVDRQVVFEAPARGQGEVVLSGNSFEWRTKKFKSFKVLGKQTFVASFDAEFQGMKSILIFKGTYLKGNNKLSYTGDIYKLMPKDKKPAHIGVFSFKYDR